MKTTCQVCLLGLIVLLGLSCEEKFNAYGIELEEEYVEASFNGQLRRLNTVNSIEYSVLDTTASIINTDQLLLGRGSQNGDAQIQFHLIGWQIASAEFPLEVNLSSTIPVAILWYFERPPDGRNAIFYEGTALDLTISSWDENDIMEGTFSGVLFAEEKGEIQLEDGKFRLKIIR